MAFNGSFHNLGNRKLALGDFNHLTESLLCQLQAATPRDSVQNGLIIEGRSD